MVEHPRPRRLGHVVLNVRDLAASVRFYTEIVGLEVSDYIEDQMAFLRCGHDHHDLALAQIDTNAAESGNTYRPGRPGLEHFSYELASLAEIEEAARFLQSRGIEMPITQAVCRVLFENVAPRDAVQALLSRDAKAE